MELQKISQLLVDLENSHLKLKKHYEEEIGSLKRHLNRSENDRGGLIFNENCISFVLIYLNRWRL
jgi:hypothetical protein